MRAVILLFGVALVAASALYVDAALTKAIDDAFDGDADWLDPTLPRDLKNSLFHDLEAIETEAQRVA